MAGYGIDILDYGNRHIDTIYRIRTFHRVRGFANELFPVVNRYLTLLLYSDSGYQELVYKEVRSLVVKD